MKKLMKIITMLCILVGMMPLKDVYASEVDVNDYIVGEVEQEILDQVEELGVIPLEGGYFAYYDVIKNKEYYNTFGYDYYSEYGIMNNEGKMIMPISNYKQPIIHNGNVYVVEHEQGIHKLINTDGDVLYEADSIDVYDNVAIVKNYDDETIEVTTALIDLSGNILVGFEKYHMIYPFLEGLAAVDDKYGIVGFIDEQGKEVIGFKYTFVENEDGTIPTASFSYFINGKAVVFDQNGKALVIDKEGEEFYTDTYKNIKLGNELHAVQNEDNQWGFIDTEGNLVIDFEYAFVYPFSNDYGVTSVMNADEKWAVINDKGELLTDFEFSRLQKFESSGRVFGYDMNDALVTVDHQGTVLDYEKFGTTQVYNNIGIIKTGENKWSFIDENNNQLIQKEYDNLFHFADYIEKDGSYLYEERSYGIGNTLVGEELYNSDIIDTKGNILFSIEDGWITNYKNGLALVTSDDGQTIGFIDSNGEVVIPRVYQVMPNSSFENGYAVLKESNDKYLIVKNPLDETQQLLVPGSKVSESNASSSSNNTLIIAGIIGIAIIGAGGFIVYKKKAKG